MTVLGGPEQRALERQRGRPLGVVAMTTVRTTELGEAVMEVADRVGTSLAVARPQDRRAEERHPGKDDDQDEYDGQKATTPTLSLPAGKVASSSP